MKDSWTSLPRRLATCPARVGDDELIAVTLDAQYQAEVEDVWHAITDPRASRALVRARHW